MGESDEKLADRIKLYAVSTVPQAKRSVLNDLISVCLSDCKSFGTSSVPLSR